MLQRLSVLSLLFSFVFLGCGPEKSSPPLSDYRPILMERSELEQSVKLMPSHSIGNFGKIYRNGHLLFINEPFEGQHIYDNSDPANPVALGFLAIPGNVDIAIKDDIIYADNAVDLVTLRYDGAKVTELARNRNVFPEAPAPDGGYMSSGEANSRPDESIIVKWTLRD